MANERWYAGKNEEWFCVGPFDTEEEAVAEFRSEHCDTERFVTGLDEPIAYSVNADVVLDQVNEEMWERVAEYEDEPFSNVTTKQQEELGERLTATLHAWMKELGIATEVTAITAKNVHHVVQPDSVIQTEPFA